MWLLVPFGALVAWAIFRRREEPVREPAALPITAVALVVPPVTVVPVAPAITLPVWGPPGLLLRREPEIRGLLDDALFDYVRTIELYGEGNLAIEWRDSLNHARAERLVRSLTGAPLGSRPPLDLRVAIAWLDHLRQIGMPLRDSEVALRVNLRDEVNWRAEQQAQGAGRQAPAAAAGHWPRTVIVRRRR